MAYCPECGAKTPYEGEQLCDKCRQKLKKEIKAYKEPDQKLKKDLVGEIETNSNSVPKEKPKEEKPKAEESEEETVTTDVKLEMNNNRFYMETFRGIFDLKVSNMSTDHISDIWLKLSSDDLNLQADEVIKRLKPEKSDTIKIQQHFKEGIRGEILIKIEIRYKIGKSTKIFKGIAEIQVLEYMEQLKAIDFKPVVDIKDKFGWAGENVINVYHNISAGNLKTGNDLMNHDLPDKPVEIPLRFEYIEVEEVKPRKWVIIEELYKQKRNLNKARLSYEIKGGKQNILLLSKPKITFGKQRDNDIALRIFPCKEDDKTDLNYQRTGRISRLHGIFKLNDEGFFVKDESTHGIFFNNKKLKREENFKLKDASSIRIDIFLELGFKICKRLPSHACPTIDEWLEITGERAFHTEDNRKLINICKSSDMEAITIERLNNIPQEKYIILISAATIGRAKQNAIVIHDDSVSEIHARILFFNSTYYLQDFGSTDGTLITNEQLEIIDYKLKRNELAPLIPGTKIKLGDVEISFNHFQQLYL